MGIRLGALLIDAGVMLGALFVAAAAAEAFGVDRSSGEAAYSAGATAAYFMWYALLLVYHPICWWAFQGSIGQRILGLRVLRARDGGPIGVGATLIRYLVWAGCQLTVVLALIAAGIASSDPARQAWWDEAARTAVVKTL
jgi:uncharacterized RDD family membrane protein YckC